MYLFEVCIRAESWAVKFACPIQTFGCLYGQESTGSGREGKY